MTPIIGSMKHTDVAPTFTPQYNPQIAFENIQNAVERFQQTIENWRKTAGETPASWDKRRTIPSKISLKRSPKTGKVLFSESRQQNRTGHDVFQSSTIKPKTIDAFINLETQILSIPALSHPGFRFSFQSWRDETGMYSLQDCPLTPYARHIDFLNRIQWMIKKLKPISVHYNDPLWIVDKKIIPAASAVNALLVYKTFHAMREQNDKMDQNFNKIPNVNVGKLENMEMVKEQWTSLIHS